MKFLFIPSILSDDWHTICIKATVVGIFWLLVVFAVMLDLWSGLDRAKALGEKPRSDKFRRTVTKIGDYWRLLAFGFMLDIVLSSIPFYNIVYASILVSIACICIELKSVIENSRVKKSKAAEIPALVEKLIKCTDAEKMKELLQEYINLGHKHE